MKVQRFKVLDYYDANILMESSQMILETGVFELLSVAQMVKNLLPCNFHKWHKLPGS